MEKDLLKPNKCKIDQKKAEIFNGLQFDDDLEDSDEEKIQHELKDNQYTSILRIKGLWSI